MLLITLDDYTEKMRGLMYHAKEAVMALDLALEEGDEEKIRKAAALIVDIGIQIDDTMQYEVKEEAAENLSAAEFEQYTNPGFGRDPDWWK